MKTIKIIIAFAISIVSNAQNPIINILDDDGSSINGAYYKDINNLLDTFQGSFIIVN